jgi:probable phosphoglycerate mutase
LGLPQTPSRLLRLFLVRHGETAWSLAARHTGRTDLALTQEGESEARALGERLCGAAFGRVFCSPLLRARRTCELSGWGAVAELEPDLREWDYGEYEGRRSADIRKGRPDWDIFRDGCPGGESPGQVSDRADRLIARLRGMPADVALFTHGHFGRVLGARWIGLPLDCARRFVFGTASFSILGNEDGRADEPVIVQWNIGANEARAADVSAKRRAIERWETEGGEIPP